MNKHMEIAMNYKVEEEFEAYGYKCAVIFHRMGHRCGYVGVPRDHPLYGKHYDERLPINVEDCPDLPVVNILAAMCLDTSKDKRINIANFFQVHGGITYAKGEKNYPIESDGLWWFGFDCAHAGDSPDYDKVQEYFGETPFRYNTPDDVVRSLEYAVNETVNLATQLREYEVQYGDHEKEIP